MLIIRCYSSLIRSPVCGCKISKSLYELAPINCKCFTIVIQTQHQMVGRWLFITHTTMQKWTHKYEWYGTTWRTWGLILIHASVGLVSSDGFNGEDIVILEKLWIKYTKVIVSCKLVIQHHVLIVWAFKMLRLACVLWIWCFKDHIKTYGGSKLN